MKPLFSSDQTHQPILKKIVSHIPWHRVYVEPWISDGSVFFHLSPQEAVINGNFSYCNIYEQLVSENIEILNKLKEEKILAQPYIDLLNKTQIWSSDPFDVIALNDTEETFILMDPPKEEMQKARQVFNSLKKASAILIQEKRLLVKHNFASKKF